MTLCCIFNFSKMASALFTSGIDPCSQFSHNIFVLDMILWRERRKKSDSFYFKTLISIRWKDKRCGGTWCSCLMGGINSIKNGTSSTSCELKSLKVSLILCRPIIWTEICWNCMLDFHDFSPHSEQFWSSNFCQRTQCNIEGGVLLHGCLST